MAEAFISGARHIAALILVATLATGSVAAGGKNEERQKPTVQERILSEAPEGTFVQVRLVSKERLRGRVASVHEHGFVMKVANGDRIADREVRFDEVKKLKVRRQNGMSSGAKVAVAIGAVAGATFLVLLAVAFAVG